MASGQKEAFDTQKALERLRDMLAARHMLWKNQTTVFDLQKLDTQIRLASLIAADGIRKVDIIRGLAYDELTRWTRILAEAREKLYEMEAEALLEALGHVERGLKEILSHF